MFDIYWFRGLYRVFVIYWLITIQM